MTTVIGPTTTPRTLASTLAMRIVTFSSSYSSGGEAIAPGQVGLKGISGALCNVTSASAGGVANAAFNASTGKTQAFATAAEVSAATNLSGVTVDCYCFGVA